MSDNGSKCPGGVFEATPIVGNLVTMHHPDHKVEPGVVIPIKKGEPVPEGGRVVRQQADGKWREAACTAGGPAKVNSDEYREGWGRIFGGKPVVGQA